MNGCVRCECRALVDEAESAGKPAQFFLAAAREERRRRRSRDHAGRYFFFGAVAAG
jgi:hypothetical protein